jgi:DNA-binding winged helix-turn-helix (wHTH) protein
LRADDAGHATEHAVKFFYSPLNPSAVWFVGPDDSSQHERGSRQKGVTMLPTPHASVAVSAVWHFDDFVLDLPRYELRRGGAAIRMEPQVFDVMTHLVSNHQRLVTKNELFDTVWGGRFVGEAALTSRIKAARQALGDDGTSQRYIRTVRGRGYQFVGDIVAAPQAASSTVPVVTNSDRVIHVHLRHSPGYGQTRSYAASTRRRILHGPPR